MIRRMKVPMAAALIFAAGAANGLANAAEPVETAAPAGPTEALLLSRETSAYEAWKSRDAKFWDSFLSDKFVGWGSSVYVRHGDTWTWTFGINLPARLEGG